MAYTLKIGGDFYNLGSTSVEELTRRVFNGQIHVGNLGERLLEKRPPRTGESGGWYIDVDQMMRSEERAPILVAENPGRLSPYEQSRYFRILTSG
ncbi:MAG: hypothetical protein HYT70_02695 [Candidatus Aenigmarchaeota archaeon]|nr:hypothetical protein [Candidatus Aenigmarchaeota archaeon]